jgi:hypothetical protein
MPDLQEDQNRSGPLPILGMARSSTGVEPAGWNPPAFTDTGDEPKPSVGT